MKKFRLLIMMSGLTLLLPITGIAQSVSDLSELSPEDRRAYMQSMSQEERQAKREQWQAEMQGMPEADRKAMHEKMAANRPERGNRDRAAKRERWESMSDEERAAAKGQRQERKQQHREAWNSMTDEERAAARERFGHNKGPGKSGGRQHKGERKNDTSQSDTAE